MTGHSPSQPNTEQVAPCPTCPEGWRPVEKEHCAECYEGQIAALRAKVDELTAALREIGKEVYTDGKPTKAARTASAALAIHSQHQSTGEK